MIMETKTDTQKNRDDLDYIISFLLGVIILLIIGIIGCMCFQISNDVISNDEMVLNIEYFDA